MQLKKGKDLKYSKLKTNEYLISNKFTVQQSKLLFKIRSRMLAVKMNFKNKYKDNEVLLQCKICNNGEMDDQQHVISCPSIANNQNINFKYSDLFSENLSTVKAAIIQFEKSWNEMSTKTESIF